MDCSRVLDHVGLCGILKDVYPAFIFIILRIKLSASRIPGYSVALSQSYSLIPPFSKVKIPPQGGIACSVRTMTIGCGIGLILTS